MKDQVFLDAIKELAVGTARKGGQDKPITLQELDILYDTIEDAFGLWQAGNFVKMCPHLDKPNLSNVAQAILDLSSNHWFYELTIEQSKKRTSYKVESYRNSWSFSGDFYGARSSSTCTEMVQRYNDYGVNTGNDDMKAFLTQHFVALTERQRSYLSQLRPGADGLADLVPA